MFYGGHWRKPRRLCLCLLIAIQLGCGAYADVTPSLEMSVARPSLGGGGRPDAVSWSRSPVYGRNGMAATAHPLASQIAIDILKQGGSALDGAIAANAALGLMEPTGNGIGGDIFFIIWDPKTEQLYGYNGSGRAPLGRSLAELKSQIAALRERGAMPDDMIGMPQRGSLPVTVPGTVDGWFAAHEQFGKLPMSDVLAPTVRYARGGFPITPVIAYYFWRNLAAFKEQEALIEELDNAAAIWFPDGTTPQTGDVFRNPDLANTLELLGEQGRAAFYEGELAEVMDGYFKRIGAMVGTILGGRLYAYESLMERGRREAVLRMQEAAQFQSTCAGRKTRRTNTGRCCHDCAPYGASPSAARYSTGAALHRCSSRMLHRLAQHRSTHRHP